MTPPKIYADVGPVDVQLDAGDALMVGLSIHTLARNGRVADPDTAALYMRVGSQLVAAARAKALGQ